MVSEKANDSEGKRALYETPVFPVPFESLNRFTSRSSTARFASFGFPIARLNAATPWLEKQRVWKGGLQAYQLAKFAVDGAWPLAERLQVVYAAP